MLKRLRTSITMQISLLALLLLLLCIIYRLTLNNTYTAYIPTQRPEGENAQMRIFPEDGDVIDIEGRNDENGYIRLAISPDAPGKEYLNIMPPNGDALTMGAYHVGRFMTVFDRNTGGFTGDTFVLAAITAFCFGVAFLMLRKFLISRGLSFYSYMSVYTSGFSVFALTAGVQMLVVTIRRIADPAAYPMFMAYAEIQKMSYRFIMITAPLVLIFSAAMAISNIELLRHEARRFRNVLGIFIAVMLIGGEAAAFWLYSRNFMGSELEFRLHNTFQGLYATAFVYFECMLIGAVICGIMAAKHVPDLESDYVIILGCAFRKDGSLTPLLKGRVDRAVAFGREQKERTGHEPVYVPSGGQGHNEIMPEAEAMGRYLMSIGIPEEKILKECNSRNTYENMLCSKRLIEPDDRARQSHKVVFSTTNYHVFRSGVWARLAGLEAEGIGCSTKWWFWPNAFVRECVGLLANRWKQELIGMAAMTAFFAALTFLMA